MSEVDAGTILRRIKAAKKDLTFTPESVLATDSTPGTTNTPSTSTSAPEGNESELSQVSALSQHPSSVNKGSAGGLPPTPPTPEDPEVSSEPPRRSKKMASSSLLTLQDAHKLKGIENYPEWRDKVLNIAESNDISKFVDPESKNHIPKEVGEWDSKASKDEREIWKEWKAGEARMKLAITLNCKSGPLQHTVGLTTALDMWEALQHQYEGSGNVLLYNAIQDYNKIAYEDFNNLEKFVVAFKLTITKLNSLQSSPPLEWHPIMFIAKVSDKWPVWAERQRSNLRASTSAATKDKEAVKFTNLDALIEDLTDEARGAEGNGQMAGQALYGNKTVPNGKGKGKGNNNGGNGGMKQEKRDTCKHCKEPNPKHPPENCGVVNKEVREKLERQWGHKYTPWSKREENAKGGNKKEGDRKGKGKKKDEDEDDDNAIFGVALLPVTSTPTAMYSRNKNRWLYDTGATEHVCNDISKFDDDYTPRTDLPLMLTVNGPSRPDGIGTCHINVLKSDGTVRKVACYNTLYMPASPVCLYSGFKLSKAEGYLRGNCLYMSSEKEICEVDSDLFLKEEESSANVAYAMPNLALPAAIEIAAQDIELWHRRLGHAGFEVIRNTRGMVTGMKFSEHKTGRTRLCAPCEKGRPIRKINKTSARTRPSKALEEICVDVVHLKPRGWNGHQYASIFTCSATSAKWAFTYAKKSEAAKANQKMIKLAQTQYGRTIKKWRCDGGREYGPSQMAELCNRLGMLLEESTPYTPEQDGRAERSIRTIMEKTRTTMIDQNIPDYMWPEILLAMVHIHNLVYTTTLEGKTPYEAFWDDIEPRVSHVPSVAHLRVIGCPCFILIQQEKRVQSHKIAPRAEKGILVGFEGHNIYRALVNGKVIRTSHIRFDEDGLVTEPNEEDVMPFPDIRGDIRNDSDNLSQSQDLKDTPSHTESSDSDNAETEADYAVDDAEAEAEAPVDAPPLSEQEEVLPPVSKRGRPLGSKNKKSNAPTSPRRSARILEADQQRGNNNGASHFATPLEQDNIPEHYRHAFRAAQEESPHLEDPQTLAEAMARTDWPHWKKAIVGEYRSLDEKGTGEVVDRSSLPAHVKVLGSRLVFKTKRDENGNIERYKVRFVVQGHTQRYGRDYDQTYAGVCKSAVWKLLLAIAAVLDLEVDQFDVITAFLNAKFSNLTPEEKIYCKLPPGMRKNGVPLTDEQVWLLLSALYGLKQSPRLWQEKLRSEFEKIGFYPLETDNCVYINRTTKIAVVTYVDDFLTIGKKGPALDAFKEEILTLFDITPSGPAKYFLGVRIARDREKKTITLCQDAYIEKILERFGMSNCKSADTPFASGAEVHMVKFKGEATSQEVKLYQQICGSLQYLSHTRWDIMYYSSILSQFLTNPSPQHLASAKRILAYLQGTRFLATTYGGDVDDKDLMKLHGYCDSDWAGSREGRVSHTGALFFFGNGVFSAISKRQTTVSLASTEAEYIAMCAFAREASWLRQLLNELGYKSPDARSIEMKCDNQGALSLSENPEFHQRTKHIDIKYHYLRQEVARGHLDPWYVPSKENTADGLTKPLGPVDHAAFVEMLNMTVLNLN